MKWTNLTRRRALAASGSILGGSRLLKAQKLVGEPPGRIAPAAELVNAYEFEVMAGRKLGGATYAEIAATDRKAMDRITFNPRMMVNTTKLNLSTDLFGDNLYWPILIGPAAEQKRFHPEGELAMARGAAAGCSPAPRPAVALRGGLADHRADARRGPRTAARAPPHPGICRFPRLQAPAARDVHLADRSAGGASSPPR